MNAIDIKNVSKSYDNFTLNNINFSLPTGMIMGLVGENGAGKSTTLKLIMNAIEADSGSISVLGASNKSEAFVDLKQDIGIVLDEAYFPEILTAQNLHHIMKHTFVRWNKDVYFNYLSQFKIPLNQKFKGFSRGMKMKLSIAVALSHEPKLLILDEATSGLDPIIWDEILNVFNDFTRDESHSILLSSHIISDLEKICDYITFLHKGKVMLCEEKDALLHKYALIKLSQEDYDLLPSDAIVQTIATTYGYQALIIKDKISPILTPENTTLEDIILFLAKEEK